MKIRLTPEIAYVFGMWVVRPSRKGLGVKGLPYLHEYFIKGVLDAQLSTSNKIRVDGKRVYFYHSGYQRYFRSLLDDLEFRFSKPNSSITSAFFAGVFDATGLLDNGVPKMKGVPLRVRLLLERMGFRLTAHNKWFYIVPHDLFIKLIKPYSQALRSGDERDPRP